MNTDNTNTNHSHPLHGVGEALATLRRKIEREFAGLIEAQSRLFHLALNEAEALAWQTGFPQLVFPALAQEKARQVAAWHDRQQSIRQAAPRFGLAARRRLADLPFAMTTESASRRDFSLGSNRVRLTWPAQSRPARISLACDRADRPAPGRDGSPNHPISLARDWADRPTAALES